LDGYIEIEMVAIDEKTGGIDVADLNANIKDDVTAVYCESPNYFGVLESSAKSIAEITSNSGAEFIIGVDPITLGVVMAPGDFGADIVVGTTQTLGVHMNAGGGVGGFIATRDEEKYAREYPTLQVSLTDTTVAGEMAFGLTLFEQSSYGSREHGKDWTGNSVYLWTVANATYMSLLGPSGFKDIGEAILQRSHYAAKKIGEIPGIKVKWTGGFFKEFLVDFNETNKSVAQINKALLAKKIFGGKDLSEEFAQYGQSALYCVTEIHTQADIDALVEALKEVTR
jgi:glycine dehydrogenase subunit 1